MKIWTLSDLHLTQHDAMSLLRPDRFPDADVCVMAGDLCESINLSVNWLGKVVRPHMPVVYVLGNHEFYGTSIEAGRKNAAMIARALDVTLLDDSCAVIGGTRFVGGTLWTDFALFAAGEGAARDERISLAMYEARRGMADFHNIDLQATRAGGPIPRLVRPRDMLRLHEETRAFIQRTLDEPYEGPTVVVTHHAPHPASVHPRYAEDPVTPAFVSDLSALISDAQPELWVHGHVHQPFDYHVGATRVLCNPRGYGLENPGFEFMKTVEVVQAAAPAP